MKTVLRRCEKEDFDYLSGVLNSYFSFTNDKKRRRLLLSFETDKNSKDELVKLLDKQIRYYGSSDLGYLWRALYKTDGGVPAQILIDDVSKKLKITLKKGGSVEAKLIQLVETIIAEELISKSPEKLSSFFNEIGNENFYDLFKEHSQEFGSIAVLPLLVKVLGPEITLGVITTIMVSLIEQLIGREAAKQIVKKLVEKTPWLNSLGPLVWTLSGSWLVLDLQGPAFRKTIPIVLYLGTVAWKDCHKVIAHTPLCL